MLFLLLLLVYSSLIGFITVLERKIIGLVQCRVSVSRTCFLGFYQFYLDFVKLAAKGLINNFYFFIYGMIVLFIFVVNSLIVFLCIIIQFFIDTCMITDLLFVIFLESNNLVLKVGMLHCYPSKFLTFNIRRLKKVFVCLEIVYFYLILIIFTFKHLAGGCGPCSFSFLLPIFIFLFIILLVKSFRTPFDYLECESELVNGVSLEFSGPSLLIWSLIEYSSILNNATYWSLLFVSFFAFGINTFTFLIIMSVFLFLLSRCIFVRLSINSAIYCILMFYCWGSLLVFIFLLI